MNCAMRLFANQHTMEVEALLIEQVWIMFRWVSVPNFAIYNGPDVRVSKTTLDIWFCKNREKKISWEDHLRSIPFLCLGHMDCCCLMTPDCWSLLVIVGHCWSSCFLPLVSKTMRKKTLWLSGKRKLTIISSSRISILLRSFWLFPFLNSSLQMGRQTPPTPKSDSFLI